MTKTKLVTIVTLLLTILLLTRSVSYAQDQTATDSSDTVTQTLKDRVQKVLQNDGGKVEGSATAAHTTFGLIGTLQKVVGSTLQITTYQGTSRVVELDKTAVIVRAGKQIKNEDIELNSPVIATGVFDQDGTYHVTRLTALTDPVTQSKRLTILGTLASLTTKLLNISVSAGISAPQFAVPFTTKTTYWDILDTKIDKKLLKATQQVLVVIPGDITATASATMSASRVYILTPLESTTSATAK